jgi:type I restriction enzyme S subunit
MTFREFQLQDILDIQWGDTKTTKASYVSEGHVAYSASGPDGFLEKFDYDREGIVLSAIGANCGSTFYATGKWSCIKNTIRIFPKTEEIDLKFFYYMTKSPHFWPRRGSAQPFISQTDIRETAVQIPDIAIQRVIGQILQELEMTIEANKQLSKTLEDTAQTIFKSWFIDFDPVKAKMAREKPVGMDDATAALFPDSMEDSELGLIPRGWLVEALSGLVQVLSGGTPKTTNAAYWSGDIPWFSVADVPQGGGVFFIKTAKTITSAGVQNSAAKLARPGVTIISARGTVGKTVLVATPSTFNQSCYGVEGKYGDYFTFLLIRSQITRLQNLSHGAMFDTITRDTFSAIQVTRAPEELISEFEKLVRPTYELIRNTQLESESLIGIRDSLLPRLISGELQIPEEMLVT